ARPAAHADRHAGQGGAAGRGAAGAPPLAVLRGARRRHQPLQRVAGPAQPGGQQIPAGAMRMTRGLFISLEGIDGAGKSSHIDALAGLFEAAGRTVRRTREPGGTPLAETLRTLVLSEPMDPLT